MKAWQIASNIFKNASPRLLTEEEQTWEANISTSDFYDLQTSLVWGSNVPGSGAPEKIMVAAIQAMENRGYKSTPEIDQLLAAGIEANEKKDMISLHQITSRLWHEISKMEKNPDSPYWNYRYYGSFEEYASSVTFPKAVEVDVSAHRCSLWYDGGGLYLREPVPDIRRSP